MLTTFADGKETDDVKIKKQACSQPHVRVHVARSQLSCTIFRCHRRRRQISLDKNTTREPTLLAGAAARLNMFRSSLAEHSERHKRTSISVSHHHSVHQLKDEQGSAASLSTAGDPDFSRCICWHSGMHLNLDTEHHYGFSSPHLHS